MKRTLVRLSLLAAVAAILAPFTGCSGGGGGGGGDDDDVIDPTHCQIIWSNIGTNTDRYDVYVVDMPIEEWFTGEKTYTLDVSDEIVAIFYDEFDFVSREYAARSITTAGTFNVTVSSTSAGQPVALTDAGAQEFFDIDGQGNTGAFAGSGGIATFDGVWSDPDPQAPPDPGDGSVVLTYHGQALTIGDGVNSFVNYAVCYEDNSFAPMTPAQRITLHMWRRLNEHL